MASTLVQRISGDTETPCGWATEPAEPELGPFAQIFTPIAWRLGRPLVQDALSCVLDCRGLAPAAMTTPAPAIDAEMAGPRLPQPGPDPMEPPQPAVDPRSLGPLQREICDRLREPLPSYIGLPRWMPGTLIISEALRSHYDCPPPGPEPELPAPVAVAIVAPDIPDAPEMERAPIVSDASPSEDVSAESPLTSNDPLATWPPYAEDVPYAADVNVPREESGAAAGGGPTTPSAVDRDVADATPPPSDIAADPLSFAEEQPFDGSVSQVRWLQSALTVDSRDPGPIDGQIGRKTMEAVQSWRQDNGRPNWTGALTETEFQAIIEQFGDRFDQIQPRARSF